MDLASLLPVAALGLRRGDSLLDTCSGPGGKALAAAQTLLPDSMLCVDHSKERLGRVAAVMDQYLRVGPSPTVASKLKPYNTKIPCSSSTYIGRWRHEGARHVQEEERRGAAFRIYGDFRQGARYYFLSSFRNFFPLLNRVHSKHRYGCENSSLEDLLIAKLIFVFLPPFPQVLCDVPCFTDRTVIREDDNNIFGSGKAFERHTLPELQSDLLQ